MSDNNKTLHELVTQKLYALLERAEKVDFSALFNDEPEKEEIFRGISLYLIDEEIKNEILLLEATAIGMDKDTNKNAFRRYAKLINREFPAYKYSFLVKKRSKEIFDREKIKERMEGVVARYINKERLQLKKKIEAHNPPLEADEVAYLKARLEERLEIEKKKIEEVRENFEDYDVVITNHAHSNVYPAIYYTLRTEGKKRDYLKQDNTHLRAEVPNLLWYKEDKPYANFRADMKIEEIIETFTPYCDMIYIKKRV